jgi:hypothetical protein
MSSFDAPPQIPFNPADWNLITHATTDAGNNQLVTAPFVTGLGTDKDNNLTFKPMDHTVCESAPPTAPLLANMTTFPWTVGPIGIGISGDQPVNVCPDCPPTRGPASAEERNFGIFFTARLPLGPVSTWYTIVDLASDSLKTETRPDTSARTETRPDGSETVTYPDGTTHARRETRPDGTKIERRPNGTMIETRPDGTKIEYEPGHHITTYPDGTIFEQYYGDPDLLTSTTRPDGTQFVDYRDGDRVVILPDGTIIEVGPDGLPKFTDPPQPVQQAEGPPAVFPGGVAPAVPGEPDVPGYPDAVFPGGIAPDPAPDVDVPGLEDNYAAPPVDQVM